jgi:hypothetical protein
VPVAFRQACKIVVENPDADRRVILSIEFSFGAGMLKLVVLKDGFNFVDV